MQQTGQVRWQITKSIILSAGLRKHIRAKLSISDDATPEEIHAAVDQSDYRRDYHVSSNTICNIRSKEVDVLWKLASKDVESCFQAVCCLTCETVSHCIAERARLPAQMTR